MKQIQAVLIRQHHLSALAMTRFRWRVFSLGMAGLLIMLLAACGGGSSSSGSSPGSTAEPAMPTGMVVAPGNNEVTVTWNALAGVTSYNIYRSTSEGQQGTKVGASSTLSYVDSTALNGVTYYYEVTADNVAGEGPVSAQSTGVTPVTPVLPPDAPTGLSAIAGNGQVTVTWTAATGSTSYNIYRSTSHGSQGTKIGASATTSYTDSTVVNGTTYYYEVTADNAAGEGPPSTQSSGVTPAIPTTVPAAPTGVNAVGGNGQVTVTWTAATGSTSYNIYRSTSHGSQGTKIGAGATTSYTDSTVVNGTTYYYEVTADNAAGEGPPSTQSSGVTPAIPTTVPAAPTGVNAVAGNGQVTVTWTAAAGSTSYNIYRSTSHGSQGTKIGAGATTSYTDSTVVNSTTYYYEVTAANAAGEGPPSTQSSGVTPAIPVTVPAPPTGVNAVAGNGQVTVTWTAATGSTSYNIYRSTSHGSQGTKIGAGATTSYTDSTAANGTTYYYEVTAVNTAGESPASTQSAGATPAAPVTLPAAPTGVNATAGDAQVTVTWTADTGATSYNIYRSTTQGSLGSKVGSSSTLSYTDSTAVNGTTYFYEVTASNAAGEGSASTQGSATPVMSWTSVKWGGGGYVDGLIYHPTSPNVLYARTDVGGAYRWNQATSKWVPITDGLGFGGGLEEAFHSIESIALDPTNDQLVYMVAGDTKNNARLYISSNRGDSWTWVTLPFLDHADAGRAIGERLMLDPTNPSTMFYGSGRSGLWKSADSGHTWAQVTGLSSYTMTSAAVGVEQIIFDNGNVGGGQTTSNIWVAVAPDYANAAGLTSTFYGSSNGGLSWTPVAVPAAVAGYYIPHFARAADGMYYVVFNTNAGPGGNGPGYLYKYSRINGGTWTLLSSITAGGYGGVSVYGSGPTTRIALAVTATWGDFVGQKITQLSDNAGSTWREIESQMPHEQNSAGYWGWNDDIEIDPNNRDHIMHLDGPGIWETMNASSATPSWSTKLNNLEETATLAVITPPAGATYTLIDSAGDIGPWVQTDLATTPTKGPNTGWSNGNSADMSWSDPQYIALTGVTNANNTGFGYWSGDGGTTWASFATLPPGAAANTHQSSNIAVTARNNAIWAPPDTVPSYTTDNGASWTATNLPALPATPGFPRSYRLAADRKNPNKVYAFDSGGAAYANPGGRVYVSTDGGHNYTLSQGSVSANMHADAYFVTAMVVNPNVEGDIWVADGYTVYHSVDSGATWTKFNNFASLYTGTNWWADTQGANALTLGKAAVGAPYSAAVYVSGVINGQWGVWESDNAGSTWTRFNDDAHQFGGIGTMAGDWNTYGRIYAAGGGRGVLYSN